jgi:transposase InsO family protein
MLTQEWFSAAELAAMALPSLPNTKRGIILFAERSDWQRAEWRDVRWRQRKGRGGGVEYCYTVLPQVAQIALTVQFTQVAEAQERAAAKQQLTQAEMWRFFDALPAQKKAKAGKKLEALDAVRALTRGGMGKLIAMQQVAAHCGVKLSSLYSWERCVDGIDRHDWLPYLAPKHAGRGVTVECSDEAWNFLKADYLRPERPDFEACWRRLERAAKEHGWTLPSRRTMARRIDALPQELRVFARDGADALKQLYPAQQRDRGVFHALEAVNADGHKWDVFVKWPDGVVGRPMMVAFQDLYSGKLLAWRIDRSENKEATRLAFGDLVEQFGIPDMCWLDNGRAFTSKWITGQTPNRYRFKMKDDDPKGIMTQLGVEIHFTTPYAGQSKPIERAFRDFAGDVAKHPKFAGAYTGNDPLAKPENYGSKAVPLAVFLEVLELEIAAHNARAGRRAAVCAGRSFDETFNASYATSPIRKATAEQRRLWLLAAEAITVSRTDGSITLLNNRYWSEFLHQHRGHKVTVRFDPQRLHDDLQVYRLDGAYLGAARCIDRVGFADMDGAQQHARDRNSFIKATKARAKAELRLSIADAAALLPAEETPAPAPQTRVVRMVRGAVALKPMHAEEEEGSQDAVFDTLSQMNAARRGGVHLHVVNPESDGD